MAARENDNDTESTTNQCGPPKQRRYALIVHDRAAPPKLACTQQINWNE